MLFTTVAFAYPCVPDAPTYDPPARWLSTGLPWTMAAGDFDGAGAVSLIWSDAVDPQAWLDRAPFGEPPEPLSLVSQPYATLVVEDFDGDGYDDLFTTNPFAWAPGGPEGLGAAAPLDVSSTGWPVSPVGDLDGDGFDDLVVGTVVLHGSPTGPQADGELPDSIDAATGLGDLDGDGRAELFGTDVDWAGRPLSEWLLLGDGSAPVALVPDPADWGDVTSATAADVDGDGVDEVIVGSTSGLYAFALDGQQVRFVAGLEPPARFTNRRDAVGADLDGDGYRDLITADRDLQVWRGGPAGIDLEGPPDEVWGLSIPEGARYWGVNLWAVAIVADADGLPTPAAMVVHSEDCGENVLVGVWGAAIGEEPAPTSPTSPSPAGPTTAGAGSCGCADSPAASGFGALLALALAARRRQLGGRGIAASSAHSTPTSPTYTSSDRT